MSEPIVLLVGIGLLSISCQYLAYRLKIPAILPLLLIGLLAGPATGWLQPDALFGDLLFPFVSLSVAIILFEGALTLNFSELEKHGKIVSNLCSIGVLVTWLTISPVAYWLFDLPWSLAFLFGALVTVTGPTVIMPMLRSVRPTANVSKILRWEGILIDPVGALLAVLVFEFIVVQQDALTHTLITFAQTLAVGLGTGALFGWLLALVLKKHWLPHYLRNTAVLTLVLGAFEVANVMAMESGLLTVTIMGVWLANTKNLDVDDILEFKETLSVLLISGLFIILAARIDAQALLQVAMAAPVLMLVLIFVSRPLGVWLSARNSDLNNKEKLLLSWIAPRGIVAAAVSALFALKLAEQGFADASKVVSLVFIVIVVTVVLQSLLSSHLARWLGVQQPAADGYLFFGANAFARMLAAEMQRHGITIKLADPNWEAVSQARMQNAACYFGNPCSEKAERDLDLTGLGHLLILSPYTQLNPFVSQYFEYEFGADKVQGLDNISAQSDQGKLAQDYSKNLGLFDATYSALASAVHKGAEIKCTPLTDNFTLSAYEANYPQGYIPLFAIDPKGKLKFYKRDANIKVDSGWKLVSLINPQKQ